MNFAQNQRECQDKSPMYMTEEKQIYLIKKKSVSQNSYYLQCNPSGIENEGMREKMT